MTLGKGNKLVKVNTGNANNATFWDRVNSWVTNHQPGAIPTDKELADMLAGWESHTVFEVLEQVSSQYEVTGPGEGYIHVPDVDLKVLY